MAVASCCLAETAQDLGWYDRCNAAKYIRFCVRIKGPQLVRPTTAIEPSISNMSDFRIEKDSLGDVKVPANAFYGAQTQRARENFPISGTRFTRPFIRALGIV